MSATRLVVTGDDEEGRGVALFDGTPSEVLTDPARPGFASGRMWLTDRTPARAYDVAAAVGYPQALEPPSEGSVLRVLTIPPDSGWAAHVSSADVAAYFDSAGSPWASRYTADGPHPYLQETGSLDFCIVVDGTVTLVLDRGDVTLQPGDVAVLCGGRHSWSNRTSSMCTLVVSSHDGRGDRG